MMRTFSRLLLAVILIFALQDAARAEFTLTASLSGAQEVPPVVTPGRGFATVIISSDETQINYDGFFENLVAPTLFGHIHWGPFGVNGPILFNLDIPEGVTSGTFEGILTADDLQPFEDQGILTFADAIAAIKAHNTYINIHSTEYPPGEIRGQIIPEPGSLLLMGLGVAAVAGFGWRRRRRGDGIKG